MADPLPDDSIDIQGRPFLRARLGRHGSPTGNPPADGGARLVAAATGAPAPEPTTVPADADEPTLHHGVPISVTRLEPVPTITAPTPIINPERAARDLPMGEVDPNQAGLDWALVRKHVQALDLDGISVRDRASFDVANASAGPETDQEERALTQIKKLVEDQANRDVMALGDAHDWSPSKRAAHIQAVFDEAFRYGRFAPLLRENLESFNVYGTEKVVVIKPGGAKETRPSIAETVEELDSMVNRIATDRKRSFSNSHGKVRVDIGGGRLTAIGGPVQVPETIVAVRRHTHVDITLQDCVAAGMLTPRMAEFLTASVRAYMSNLISGWANTGKTTFLRALMSALAPEETLVTLETERELYLEKLPKLHEEVVALQYMPATGDGDTAAAFSLDEALEYAKRYNAQTFVFGEILGAKEASTAVSAFQGGKGTSSTIHAKSTKGAISALSRFLTEAGSFSDNLVPQQEILDSISFIIQISTIPQQNGSLKRVVTQVAQLIPSDTGLGRVKAIPKILFEWDRHAGVHIAKEPPLPEIQRELLDAGLREDFFEEWVA